GLMGRLRVADGGIGQEGGEDRQGLIRRRCLWPPLILALVAAASGRDLASGVEVSTAQRVHQLAEAPLEAAEAGEQQPGGGSAVPEALAMDQGPGGRQQVGALADEKLAEIEDTLVSLGPAAQRGRDRGAVAAEGIRSGFGSLSLQADGELLHQLQGLRLRVGS